MYDVSQEKKIVDFSDDTLINQQKQDNIKLLIWLFKFAHTYKNSTQSNIKKLFLHPLGQNHSFVHEIIFFSGKNWKKLFLKNGFKIKEVKQGPYITSGYGVLKFKLISFRKFFAKYFFSSSYCFILKL
jgi:hypothetical protein